MLVFIITVLGLRHVELGMRAYSFGIERPSSGACGFRSSGNLVPVSAPHRFELAGLWHTAYGRSTSEMRCIMVVSEPGLVASIA